MKNNQVGVADPMLAPLADNGGSTMTHALLCDSPAIDRGSDTLALDADNNPLTTDQRGTGFDRICDGDGDNTATVDIGAFEAQAPLVCNQSPVAQCQNVTVYLNSGAATTANASIDNGSYDPDNGDTITVAQSPAGPYPVGSTQVTLTVTDNHGASSTCQAAVTVLYSFNGFFHPVDNLPTVNVVNAGRAIPVKFSLGGNKGLNIFAADYPISAVIACNFSGGTSDVEETVTAGGSSLSYDAATGA